MKVLNDLRCELLTDSPYSLDRAPSDYHALSKMKNLLRVVRFENLSLIKMNRWIADTPKTSKLVIRKNRCIPVNEMRLY